MDGEWNEICYIYNYRLCFSGCVSNKSSVSLNNSTIKSNWIKDQNGCKHWNHAPSKNEKVTWTGKCVKGFASGYGIMRWYENNSLSQHYEGSKKNGYYYNYGILEFKSGKKYTRHWIYNRKQNKYEYMKPQYKRLGLTKEEYTGYNKNTGILDFAIYGIYACSDPAKFSDEINSACDDNSIHVLAYKDKVKKALKDINKLHIPIDHSKEELEMRYCVDYQTKHLEKKYRFVGLPESINDVSDKVCIYLKPYSGNEAKDTIAVRELDSIIYAIRPFGERGGGVIADISKKDFAKKSKINLVKKNQLDKVSLAKKPSLEMDFVRKE